MTKKDAAAGAAPTADVAPSEQVRVFRTDQHAFLTFALLCTAYNSISKGIGGVVLAGVFARIQHGLIEPRVLQHPPEQFM